MERLNLNNTCLDTLPETLSNIDNLQYLWFGIFNDELDDSSVLGMHALKDEFFDTLIKLKKLGKFQKLKHVIISISPEKSIPIFPDLTILSNKDIRQANIFSPKPEDSIRYAKRKLK